MITRQKNILKLLEKEGEITIRRLSELLNVSEMTVHRDLNFLEENKYLYKKRGAAVFIPETENSASDRYEDEKRRIGKLAASLIRPGQSVLIDNSTTALEAARFLKTVPHLTFYTTSLEAAGILSGRTDSVLYCSGGYYFPDSHGFAGTYAEKFVDEVNADVCIIGASGISISRGITNPYPMHTALQRKIIEHSKMRILVADHSKFGRVSMEYTGKIEEMDCIITDTGILKEDLEQYGKLTKIITA